MRSYKKFSPLILAFSLRIISQSTLIMTSYLLAPCSTRSHLASTVLVFEILSAVTLILDSTT